MKKYLIMLLAAVTLAASCDKEPQVKTYELTVTTSFENLPFAKAGQTVEVKDNNSGVSYSAKTDENGTAVFKVPVGSYTVSVSSTEYSTTHYNGLLSNVVVAAGVENIANIALTKSISSPVVIKELYVTGCTYALEDGSTKSFNLGKYVTLYNNSPEDVDISNYGLAFVAPYNAYGTNPWLVDGVLSYIQSSYVPVATGVWYFNRDVTIAPYSQIVISIDSAIDNTVTYSTSVDLSKADYACYDPESGFNNANTYPTPAASIPASNYMKVAKFTGAKGTAWPISSNSPGFILFCPAGKTVAEWASDVNLDDNTKPTMYQAHKLVKEYIVDAVELFSTPKLAASSKRLTPDIDAGYVAITNALGYSVYRNVDKVATEAIAENKGKIVYNYAGGTGDLENGSTDPSGINAEASIANGAKIVFLDTNNSTKDMHQRAKATLAK